MNTHAHHTHQHPGDEAAETVRDPVCGMIVKSDTPHRLNHEGEEVLFCSAGCKARFEADPLKYMGQHGEAHHSPHGPAPVDPSTVLAGSKWTCPMHPQIVRDGPGSCPICGMALEPMLPTADDGPNPELKDMERRFVVGLVLAAPVLALEMGRHLFGVDRLVAPTLNPWLQLGSELINCTYQTMR